MYDPIQSGPLEVQDFKETTKSSELSQSLWHKNLFKLGKPCTERIYYKAPLYHEDTAQGNIGADLGPGVDSVLSKKSSDPRQTAWHWASVLKLFPLPRHPP